jgi:hypothetical protein
MQATRPRSALTEAPADVPAPKAEQCEFGANALNLAELVKRSNFAFELSVARRHVAYGVILKQVGVRRFLGGFV